MRTALTGLAAVTLTALFVVYPAFAGTTLTRLEKFAALDVNQDGNVSLDELLATGCKVHPSVFKYVDENSNGILSRAEYKSNYELVKRCTPAA
jgi:hypothetical protein